MHPTHKSRDVRSRKAGRHFGYVLSLVVCLLGVVAGCSEPAGSAPTTRTVARPRDANPVVHRPPRSAVSESSAARTHRVGPDDTLYGLALTYYDDGNQWRRIFYANRNRISNPRALPVGMMLIIPP